MIAMVLSVLIPTVPRRLESFFPALVRELERQAAAHPDVEILGLYDNRRRSVGEKRNALLQMASGKYLTFIDDDDWVEPDYLDTILPPLRDKDIDVLVFGQNVTVNDGPPKLCLYGVELVYFETADLWTGKPAHTMVWKSDIAKKERFPDANYKEDTDWCGRMVRHVNPDQQHRIDRVLYHYRFNNATTETR